MRSKKNIKLVTGKFSAEDARNIVINLISYKINFHQMKNFSQHVRSGKNDKHSEKRITELLAMKESLLAFFEEAEKNGYKLKIGSEIRIEVEK